MVIYIKGNGFLPANSIYRQGLRTRSVFPAFQRAAGWCEAVSGISGYHLIAGKAKGLIAVSFARGACVNAESAIS